ncbi:MAG: hypothetical protein ACLVBP_09800 [Ruminococcus sp.]
MVIGVLTQSELYEKTISNMVECKSRGAYLMGLTTYGNYNIEDTASFTVYVPKTEAVLCHKPCGDSVTAYGILRQRGKGT